MTLPVSVSEVASWRWQHPGEPLWKPLGEFLDGFYAAPSPSALAEEPVDGLSRADGAYLAATAEYLSLVYGFDPPAWVEKPAYFLDVAHWPEGAGRAMRAICLAESPTSFRRRFIFTEGRPLRRKNGPRFSTA